MLGYQLTTSPSYITETWITKEHNFNHLDVRRDFVGCLRSLFHLIGKIKYGYLLIFIFRPRTGLPTPFDQKNANQIFIFFTKMVTGQEKNNYFETKMVVIPLKCTPTPNENSDLYHLSKNCQQLSTNCKKTSTNSEITEYKQLITE